MVDTAAVAFLNAEAPTALGEGQGARRLRVLLRQVPRRRIRSGILIVKVDRLGHMQHATAAGGDALNVSGASLATNVDINAVATIGHPRDPGLQDLLVA